MPYACFAHQRNGSILRRPLISEAKLFLNALRFLVPIVIGAPYALKLQILKSMAQQGKYEMQNTSPTKMSMPDSSITAFFTVSITFSPVSTENPDQSVFRCFSSRW